ncbi:hypothetical protein LPMP_261010 [Leishmania panamensis]|uniref:Uncharacterized protein n=2 Tax=Leishmania guyanensis species complex TaxID=38579 RepID=A0A088RVE7_LEIPA|nr:hypothetical protein LPMP_261010 [Leishmania panamensis]AIN99214.1 hypothetical protein LPMP_261010 [Leishmania panamensis]
MLRRSVKTRGKCRESASTTFDQSPWSTLQPLTLSLSPPSSTHARFGLRRTMNTVSSLLFSSCPTAHHPMRWVSRKSIEEQLPSNIKVDPNAPAIAAKDGEGLGRDAFSSGINGIYGNRAESAMRGMLGPQGQADARESRAVPILGRASVQGTKYTLDRSTVFENWRFRCPEPVGWHLSMLGSTTCKMVNDVNEAVESLQLQIIKGCNVFEIDGAASEIHQSIARGIYEALQAFELDRNGFVMVARCGLIKQPRFQDEITRVETSNTAAARNRIIPIFERYKASSLPSTSLKSGFRISELDDSQLARLNLRRVDRTTAAGLSPDWLDAFFTNVAYNTRLECIDVLLLEGVHTLFDGRPDEHVDDDILQLFAYLERQVKEGVLQYYGVCSPHLAPPVPRNYPEMPPDALVPDKYRTPPKVPATINLYRLMSLAERAGGADHHFRFVQYPFNLTQHQAMSSPLSYDANHTLATLCKALGLTAIGYSPLEATNLMQLPERYHNFPMEADLKALRMNFFTVCERSVLKEMEIKDTIDKGPSTLPPLEHLFVASVYLAAQRQFTNLFFFTDWANYYMTPRFRRAMTRFKEASNADLKEWAKQYEQLINDLLRMRQRMFQHKHGKQAGLISMAIDYASPTLARCPMLNQKAINFATYGCDVLLCGFHVSRYFHEATELNPAKDGNLPIPEEELLALCKAEAVSYANVSPPHPYMLEPLIGDGKISKQPSKGSEHLVPIDPQNPKFPDIPEELQADNSSSDAPVSADDPIESLPKAEAAEKATKE